MATAQVVHVPVPVDVALHVSNATGTLESDFVAS